MQEIEKITTIAGAVVVVSLQPLLVIIAGIAVVVVVMMVVVMTSHTVSLSFDPGLLYLPGGAAV